jgi:dienelactone hydrolase
VRLPRLVFPLFAFGVAAVSRAASFDDRVEALFRPPLGEMIALSPDGQRVAYTSQRGGDLALVMMSIDPPGAKRTVKITPERDPAAVEQPAPARLRFLRWATPTRLVYAPVERVAPLPPIVGPDGRSTPNPDGPAIIAPILAVDADGNQRGAVIDASAFQETPATARRSLADFLRTPKELAVAHHEPVRWRMPHLDILGFYPRDREQLIIGTHGAYSVPLQHAVDIRTGNVVEFGGEWPTPPPEPQVFDWYRLKLVGERQPAVHPTTAWRDEELGRVQHELERKFPGRTVEILDWSETRARVLFRVTGGSDPGRDFVLQRPENLPLEILRCAPWLNAAKLHETRFFEFAAADGARISGYLTWPGKPRVSPPPLVVVFPTGFPGQAQSAFDPEAQVLADLGFAVARLNHRSVAGVRAQDLAPLRAAVDRVSVDDAGTALDGIAAQNPGRPFDRKRVATLGRGFGGYLALRALQLQPTVFRAGIAIDAPMDLRGWLPPPPTGGGNATATVACDIPVALVNHADADWKKLSVVEQAEALTSPVLLLVERTRHPAVDASVAALGERLQSLGRAPDTIELDAGFAARLPKSRAAAYRKIEEFLNLHLYGYSVKIGPTKEVK